MDAIDSIAALISMIYHNHSCYFTNGSQFARISILLGKVEAHVAFETGCYSCINTKERCGTRSGLRE
jgi:hypothetical protein